MNDSIKGNDFELGPYSEQFKRHMSPAGDVYLTRQRAEHVLRWMQILEKINSDLEAEVTDLRMKEKQKTHEGLK